MAEREEAWSGDNLIGLVAYYINHDTQKAFITNVSVDIRFQKQGIATKLLENAKCVAMEECMKLISLEAANDDELIAFYLHNGFSLHKRVMDSNSELIMHLVPMVVIRCTVYNHETYLRDCLEGFVMQQTNFPFVAIVHDDASTDNSAAIIREYEEKYPDIIKPIYETENQYSKLDGSLGRIMNAAIDATGAKYVAMCEGDDYWTDPLKLQKQVAMLENNSDVSICINQVQTITKNKELTDWVIPADQTIQKGIFSLDDFCRLEWGNLQWTFHTVGIMFRTKCSTLLYENKVMKMFPYGDLPLIISCLLQGNGCYIQEKMSCYRLDSGGYNSTMAANPERNIQQEHKLADALRAFDEYTVRKYHKYIQQRIRLCEYREYTLGKKHHWRIIMPQYWRCLPGKTARQKTLNAIEILAPNMRKRLKQMKNAIEHS